MPVGCVCFDKVDEMTCQLGRLAVLPAYRLNGIGKRLVQTVESEAMACGIEKVDISVIAEHTSLKEWYLGLGFVEGNKARFEHLPFEVLFMSRKLEEKGI